MHKGHSLKGTVAYYMAVEKNSLPARKDSKRIEVFLNRKLIYPLDIR